MSKMKIRVHEHKKQESAAGRSFYDEFIADRAREILENYDVNKSCGAMCDSWYELGDGVEDIERDDRDGFWSFNDGGVQKTWMTTSYSLVGQGYEDEKIAKDYDYLQEQCEDAYKEQCEKDGVECDFESSDFQDHFETRWWEEGCDIFAYAEIMLYSRESRNNRYTLHGRISRSFDYTYGRNPEDDLDVVMELTEEQMTQANADKFLSAVEEAFANYSFKDGYKEINVEAE